MNAHPTSLTDLSEVDRLRVEVAAYVGVLHILFPEYANERPATSTRASRAGAPAGRLQLTHTR